MNQQIYIGFGKINRLEEILLKTQAKNIFLVTGKKSYTSCGAEGILKKILGQYNVQRFSDFEVNPKIRDVEKGMEIFKKKEYDLMIAVGGGSVIDIAKLINIFSAQTESPLNYISGQKIVAYGKPFVAIPTTSGSGSESTHFAVVYIDKSKYSVAHEFILPTYAIVDPQFTMSIPPVITASTGMDALSQAIESYWAIDSTDESKKYASESIKLTLNNLEKIVNNPSRESRLNMMKASNLAGKAINITRTTAPHAVSYAFTSYFGIPHGHAIGLTLGKFLVYNSHVSEKDCVDKRGARFVKETIKELCALFDVENTNLARDKIDFLMTLIGLETDLHKLGIRGKDLNLIVENVNTERLFNNPRKITREDLKRILGENYEI